MESQQADRERRGADEQAIGDPQAVTARRTLELALASARMRLWRVTSPAHRAMLEQAIADLTAQLERS